MHATAKDIDQKVLRQLEALLAKEASLRGSAEPHSMHEAEATARAVQRLLLRHHLAMSDVEYVLAGQRNPVDAELFDPEAHGFARTQRRVYWQEELATVVAHAHLCSLLVVPGSNSVFFVGRGQDRAVAAYALGMLLRFADATSRKDSADASRRLTRAGQPAGACKGFRNAWLRGFNLRIAERYRELEFQMVEQAVEQNAALARLPGGTGTTGAALVRRLTVAREEARDWVAEHAGDAEADISGSTVTDYGGLRAGYMAGDRPALGARAAVGA